MNGEPNQSLRPLLQHDLQRTEAQHHAGDSPPIALAQQLQLHGLTIDGPGHRRQQRDTGEELKVENPAPGIHVRQPPAHGRTGRLGHAIGQAEQRHAQRHLAGRQLGDDQLERQRNQHRPGRALHHADHDHGLQVWRQRTGDRRHQEQARAHQHHAAQREHLHQPGREGDHDDFRHQVRGGNPRAFLERRPQGAFDFRQRGAGDMHVHAGHETTKQPADHGHPGTQRDLGRMRLSLHGHAPHGYRPWRSPTCPAGSAGSRRPAAPGGSSPENAGRSW